jgi:hypothetical protein
LKYVLQILWAVSNNEAEYEALLHELRLAISLGIKRLLMYGDSLLVVQQVNKEWDCNRKRWTLMSRKCGSWKANFPAWRFTMCYGSTMLVQILCPNSGRHVLRSHQKFLSRRSSSHPLSLLRR